MKKIFTLLAALIMLYGCYDDSELMGRVDNLENRVSKLEKLCNEMNSNISSLQTIVSALQNNDYVTKIEPVLENGNEVGYTISFTKSEPITIYHGKDGKDGENGEDGANGSNNDDGYTPIIGVQQDNDGIYYWTLDGEWLTDDSGNKIKAQGVDGKDGIDGEDGKEGQPGSNGVDGANGKDGADGITPQLKIENDYWYVSYDNGTTWKQLGRAVGTNGDSFFQSVAQDENFVYFTFIDGSEIAIAKSNNNLDSKIIQFEDKIVERICVNNWDTDGDGYLSYDEAAAVQDIGTLFSKYITTSSSSTNSIVAGNSGIFSFKEFRFFTGVSNISKTAFYMDINLSEIELPNSIKTINGGYSNPSSSTSYVNNGAFAYTAINKIHIPNSVTTISDNAFANCKSLKYVTGGDSVQTIGRYTYYNCINLKQFTLPENLKSIKYNAFNCSGEELIIKAKIFENDYTSSTPPFDGYYPKNFTKVTFGDNITKIGKYGYAESFAKEIVIPNSVTSIGSYAFYSSDSLENINIPESVTTIDAYAFADCDKLKNITIPEGITTINSYTFKSCGLESITIPQNVTSIGSSAFKLCANLTSVTIGKSVISIGNYAFSECSKLKSVFCKAIVPPDLCASVFSSNSSGRIIYVPKEAVDVYRASWSDYADKIIGYDFE